MFTALLDSSSGRRPVLGPVDWLISLGVGLAGFVAGSLWLPVGPGTSATRILLFRAAVLGAALAVYVLAVCYTWTDARREGLDGWLWLALVIVGNLAGFITYLGYSAVKTGDWKRATLPIAYTFEVLLIGFAALVPLIYTQALPGPISLFRPYLPPPQGERPAPPSRERAPRHLAAVNILETPNVIPSRVPVFTAQPPKPPGLGEGVPGIPNGLGGTSDGVFQRLFSNNQLPPPPPEPARARPVERVFRQSEVEAARAIWTPKPEYPPIAIAARIQGTVKLHAVIGKDGSVQQLKVISGSPFLVKAAMEAVARWRYQPTLLNGRPVEVETEIDVNFVLND